MRLQFELIEEPDYLRCVVTGIYDVREAIDGFPELIVRCRATGLSKVLVDYRTMEGYPSAIERILFTEETLKLHGQHLNYAGVPIRVAFLGSPKVIGTYNPGLEIAKNRGFSATITSDLEQAIAFLMESDESAGADSSA